MIRPLRYLHFFKIPQKEKKYVARKLIGYSSEQMYSVVSDVKNYRQFLPFCTQSIILECKDDVIYANLEIGFPPIVENYTSKVLLIRPHMVHAVGLDGRLFHSLETVWKFAPGLKSNPQSCIVDFSVRFEFKSVIHKQLASMFFDKVVMQMESAFFNEAKRRYGKESVPSHILSYVNN
ncbi:coenzyme Q-binding protein COQ10 homolog B, mitochondrial [Cylas formicarius]|uniref:coenzyme Q-binding protein COQ10 homolog B, mitochondrial n=1 Tax=Cylas formicarius TaxID=197179 RepID=UPI0029589F56|nr:coenzyme Q-binding protein COQ10 homolog B, mitochondrial [Cylas formicarius]